MWSMSGRSSRSTLMLTNRLVHEASRFRILERLVRHHMAPVAGGVADREQDRTVAPLRLRQRVGAPRAPMHRIVGVLEEVGRRLAAQGDCGRIPFEILRLRPQAASAAFSIALNRRESRVQRMSAPSLSPAARLPDLGVVLVGADVQPVDHGHAAGELAVAFDRHPWRDHARPIERSSATAIAVGSASERPISPVWT